MTPEVLARLLVIGLTIAVGALLARWRVFGRQAGAGDAAAQGLGDLATFVLIPALLVRTMSRLDLDRMPWASAQAYFVPTLAYALVLWAWHRRRLGAVEVLNAGNLLAQPATRAVAATYGNAVQLGIPLAAALFGERGLAVHIALVSLHALLVLTMLTVLAEADLARGHRSAHALDAVRSALKSTLTHPVVLPVLVGLCINASGLRLPAVVDQVLLSLGSAGVPVCLLLIGMNLVHYGLKRTWRGALGASLLKLLALPALVLVVAQGVFGLQAPALEVVVMMAALPVGVNALIFGQRYRVLQAEATAAIVVSTIGFAFTAPLWLWVLGQVA